MGLHQLHGILHLQDFPETLVSENGEIFVGLVHYGEKNRYVCPQRGTINSIQELKIFLGQGSIQQLFSCQQQFSYDSFSRVHLWS
ncbi:hypothetical protein TNCT_300391 [Trichonephila clavata]|uniref:Uncharacterized protein n=1 Tax=Trichonephila clavata TaxID=2740835 RepID=A0A8X6M236_TRICU|nr:hypothetical protein TNCT_300391 [Trichonephila clavata]